ncbi:MAG TPA: hypothetical protein VFK89_09810 [Actinomycetota bacterium]|nr:hypothetical protein [Actinomycetota bacterium]
MGIRRFAHDLGDLRRGVAALFDDTESEAEDRASYRLAVSAQKFSRQAKEVVDDKLSFSATLMRAGEVNAANRLLEEVEREVRDEEAALIETVNEVKVAESIRRQRSVRIRLARSLVAATLGSALLTFSAAGMAVAGFFRDRAVTEPRPVVRAEGAPQRVSQQAVAPDKQLRRLRIGDVHLMLTKSQFQRLKALTGGGSIDASGLSELLNVLPGPLADKLQEAIGAASTQAEEVTTTLESVASDVKELPKRKHITKEETADAQADDTQTPPDEDASPQPEESPSDDQNSTPDDGDSQTDPGSGDEGDGHSPIPLRP